jgi:large subunit ribosomal protein L13
LAEVVPFMKCYLAKTDELNKSWFVIDAADMVVGRLAAQIAPILMGKHRPTYTPYIDTGDYVIVTNVDKVVFTGKKWQQKTYQRYSGHPGGQKDEVAWKLFERHPDRILKLAVQRMMPKNKIGRHMLGKLKLYTGTTHPHQAQGPIPLEALSGRPAPAGAIYAPKPVPKVKPAPAPKVEATATASDELVPSSQTIPVETTPVEPTPTAVEPTPTAAPTPETEPVTETTTPPAAE